MIRGVRPPALRGDERGVALVVVLVILALLLAVVGEFAQAMRLEAVTTVNFRNSVAASSLAEAGYHRAIAEILPDALDHELDEHGALAFRRTRLGSPAAPPRVDLALGDGRFSYRITDESARLNLNRATPEILRALLEVVGVERDARDVIVASILDWRDADEEHRLNGAESDYYLALPVPYRSKNADFDSVDELLQVRGVTPRILYGQPGAPGLAEYLTVVGAGALNVNTVSLSVLRAVGFAQAEAELLVAGRPYLDLSALATQLRRGNQRTRSDTFRIEAWGSVAGQDGPRLIAVVQRQLDRAGLVHLVPASWHWSLAEPRETGHPRG